MKMLLLMTDWQRMMMKSDLDIMTPLTLMTLERREEAESWDRAVAGSSSPVRSSTMLSPLSITTLLTRLLTSPRSVQPSAPAHEEDVMQSILGIDGNRSDVIVTYD